MSTDRKDEHLSIMARQNLLWIVAQWPALKAKVKTGGGQALTGMPSAASPTPPLVVDVNVLDVLYAIEDEARHWAWMLLDEVPARHGCNGACDEAKVPADRCPNVALAVSTSAMPELLTQIAWRHGHWTADPRMALEFCDKATELREMARKVVEEHEAPVYMGPCQTYDCSGELYVRQGKESGMCRVCGQPWTVGERQEWLGVQLDARLMTQTEIGRALKVLGFTTQMSTVRWWTQVGKLSAVEDGLYSLADAKALAEKGRVAA